MDSAHGGSSARRSEKVKNIHKAWVDFPSGAKALLTDLFIVFQLALLAFLYAFFAIRFAIFFYISIALTVCTAVYVFACERDAQCKASWLFLFLVSFGCGYIVYILASKRVCYGYDRRRYAEIFNRSLSFRGEFAVRPKSAVVGNDCKYIFNAGGYIPYEGTDVEYFPDARPFFDSIISRLESAKAFIFLEFFVLSNSRLLDRILQILERKAAQGVDIKILYDDAGSQGVLNTPLKKRITGAGISLKAFAKLFAPFSFGLNFRDHRKIAIIDGKTGYVGGCNIADEYVNNVKMRGIWKDAGVRLEGAAVDGLSLTFLRQWEFATRESLPYENYLNKYEKTSNTAIVLPYAGGPEIEEALCRGVYSNVISGAAQKLYIMTPYLVPDSVMFSQLIAKAKSGVDVRIVLPEVPDYQFIYMVTKSNAERLLKYGVKIYYAKGLFVHSKVMLTENCVTVGSANLDMRSFYQEFDNGVYTDDKSCMEGVLKDFVQVFASNGPANPVKHNPFYNVATAILRIFSPLM